MNVPAAPKYYVSAAQLVGSSLWHRGRYAPSFPSPSYQVRMLPLLPRGQPRGHRFHPTAGSAGAGFPFYRCCEASVRTPVPQLSGVSWSSEATPLPFLGLAEKLNHRPCAVATQQWPVTSQLPAETGPALQENRPVAET